MFVTSCGNSSKKSNNEDNLLPKESVSQSDDGNDIREEIVDIPITVNLSHTKDDEMRQLADAEYEITNETGKNIYIDINSNYYKKYMSHNRFKVQQLAFFENSENVEYLTLNLDVVNNTNEKLSVNELNIVVSESKPDFIPIIYICTTQSYSNCIYFVNESWFNWKGFTFSYSILKKGESFNGEYKKHVHIPYFDNYIIVDLLPDMKEMGYDYDDLVNCIRNRNIRYNRENNTDLDVEPISQGANEKFLFFHIDSNDDDFCYFQEKFWPFDFKKSNYGNVGSAMLYGTIKFDDIDFMVDFIADISLSTLGGFGALSYENDEFDVKLKSYGNNYMLRYPYTTVIEPYGTEMIKLSVVADKSSKHKFYIDIKNDNGLKIRSKDISFHHYYPKN